MDFIENGVRRKVLDFLLKSKAVVSKLNRKRNPKKGA